MTHNTTLDESIDRAADSVGSLWPLHSFVTANPLSGLEDRPFHRAVSEAERRLGGRGYPRASVFERAWEDGRIDPEILAAELDAHGIDETPEALLTEMAEADAESDSASETDPETDAVDRILSKWLSVFLDQGNAEWAMPDREAGFYAAWRAVAPYDDEIPGCDAPSDLPDTPEAALEAVLSDYSQDRWVPIFEHHLAALPGWTGFIKQRADGDCDADPWQSTYPISLTEYLAVRLTVADLLDAPIEPDGDDGDAASEDDVPLPELWLRAWEKSHRDRLVEVASPDETPADGADARPAAQLVFCIDTRSEIIRRHIEATGPYETHGYAGFFGVPMRYQGYDDDTTIDACPPIVDPQHYVTDRPAPDEADSRDAHDQWSRLVAAGRKHLKTLKSNVAAAFTFVEGAGTTYGAAMATRTLLPAAVYDGLTAVDSAVPGTPEFAAPTLDRQSEHEHDHGDLPQGMTLEEKVTYAQNAFELMGWEAFARLVVFAGHASHTTNNPFDSSLDCGACAGNPGGPNARVLAEICNDEAVKDELRDRGIDIPDDTVFLAAEHNTTTDEITLFDGEAPESHADDIERLREDLETARAGATAERADSMGADTDDGVRETQRRAADWAETRPEWGLAGNASFVIGPRELTDGEDLDGRAFLHSYDWTTDPDGEALEAIMTGPLVVTQWINNQYYFATVDNAVYGSGSKVTQNPVGNVGVYQGNGGDLMTGLPLQSLYADADRPYHQPLRLTAVIHAPVERVNEVLREHEQLRQLLDNGWIQLTVLDPEQDNAPVHYEEDLEWEPSQLEPAPVETPAVVAGTAD
ncbi:DUF2309 domain-containing protein [Natronomonas amylolytica]|uniref:DUF2309 domain-containing protein n=1 Tax=Natronomonas amylolytica TaxID=3108498 RepID=UPI0030087CCC